MKSRVFRFFLMLKTDSYMALTSFLSVKIFTIIGY